MRRVLLERKKLSLSKLAGADQNEQTLMMGLGARKKNQFAQKRTTFSRFWVYVFTILLIPSVLSSRIFPSSFLPPYDILTILGTYVYFLAHPIALNLIILSTIFAHFSSICFPP